jgi:myo-inositol-1(or 4)-monophosphatase
MADRPGPSADAEAWLSIFRRACDRIAHEVAAMAPERRAEPCGRGAGGDITVLVDRVAEDIVVEELEALGRPLTLVSEELGVRELAGGGPPLVVVDPIDGSLNAKRGMPVFATSIALADGRRMADVTTGLVRDHGTGEEYVAERGRGTWLDGRPLPAHATSPGGVMELLMLEGARPSRVVRAAEALDGRVGRLRAIGSLALSLCHTAAGRADAMVGLGPGRAVDIAVAQLVAREAGLIVGLPAADQLDGAPLDVSTRSHVVAARDHATLDLLAAVLPRPR